MARRLNNTGTVYKLSGKRANPYIVRVFEGYKQENEVLKPIYKTLGYAPTKAKGLRMLDEYNVNPFNLDATALTFSDIYEQWSREKYPTISDSNIKGYEASFKAFEKIHNDIFIDLNYLKLQSVFNESIKNYPTLKKMKTLLNQMYAYAMKCEYTNKNYSKDVNITKFKDRNPDSYQHTEFTQDEIRKLWENKHNDYVQIILMLIYNGLRISSFLNMKKCDVHLDGKYKYIHVEKDKNENSIRNVPIADVMIPFYVNWMNKNNSEYFLSTMDGKHLNYRNYRDAYWYPILLSLDMEYHKCHDARHTCGTILERAKVRTVHTQKILGHEPQNITHDVYTHLKISDLLPDINLIHETIFKEIEDGDVEA